MVLLNMHKYIGEEVIEKLESFEKIKVDVDNWKTYYFDPVTGLYWILEYLSSELQGGGEPTLIQIDKPDFI